MASSFINFKDYGFWTRDGFVEAFQLLLFEEIQSEYNNCIDWLNDYKKELAFQSLPLINGGMSMCLDETLIDENRIAVILQLIDRNMFKISADKNHLTGKHLNSLRKTVRQYLVEIKQFDWNEREIDKQIKDGAYQDELPVENYLKGFDLLRNLITGQLPYKVDTEITYWED